MLVAPPEPIGTDSLVPLLGVAVMNGVVALENDPEVRWRVGDLGMLWVGNAGAWVA